MPHNYSRYAKNIKHSPKIKTHLHVKTASMQSDSTMNSEIIQSEQIRKNLKQPLPIPKGDTPYALAKIAEYKDRDLDKAEFYYKQAITNGERVISAIKDLASLMHQRGKTKAALEYLEKNKHLFKNDQEKFENLYSTLEKQLSASANSQNKRIKISNLNSSATESDIHQMFENPVRIKSIEFSNESIHKHLNNFCIVSFNSHSSARKTLEGFHHWDKYKVEWINNENKIVGDAHYYRQKMEDYRKSHPTFDYQIFDRDPCGYIYCLPLDSSPLIMCRQVSENEESAYKLLGSQLFTTIFREKSIECF